jgi:hypothetical protein
MSNTDLKVMTITISKKVAKKIEQQYKDLKLRRDRHLAEKLKDEVERLEKIPPLSESEIMYVRLKDQLQKEEKMKIGLKLPSELVTRINKACKEKKVPRDLFIATYLDLLAYGYQDSRGFMDSFVSPLDKARVYLDDPYNDMNGEVNIYEKRFCIPALLADLLVESLQDQETQTKTKGERNE